MREWEVVADVADVQLQMEVLQLNKLNEFKRDVKTRVDKNIFKSDVGAGMLALVDL